MENHYSYECPVKQGVAKISDCMQVHNLVMQGRPERVEDKTCALACLCWMCPARHAFRMGGPWSKADRIPRADEPMEKPGKLPADIVAYALRHTLPYDSDYRRVGFSDRDPEIHQFLEGLKKSLGRNDAERPTLAHSKPTTLSRKGVTKSVSRGAATSSQKEETILDALRNSRDDDMAQAVTDLAKRDALRSAQGDDQSKTGNDTQKKREGLTARSQEPAATSKPMTMAERARLMREKRKTDAQ